MSVEQFAVRESGSYRHTFLSNGFIEPDGTFVEREYQAYAKTTDPRWRGKILNAKKPFGVNGSKQLGRSAPLRSDHEAVKFPVMAYFVARKFHDHPGLAHELRRTVGMLTEGNDWHDNIWGDCHCANADGLHPECLSPGTNWLGLILMTVRADRQVR